MFKKKKKDWTDEVEFFANYVPEIKHCVNAMIAACIIGRGDIAEQAWDTLDTQDKDNAAWYLLGLLVGVVESQGIDPESLFES